MHQKPQFNQPYKNQQQPSPGPGQSTVSSKQQAHQEKLQLCNSKYFDLPTDIEIRMRQNYAEFQQLVDEAGGLVGVVQGGAMAQGGPATNLELMNRLQKHISASETNHQKLMQGLLFAILTASQQHQAKQQSADAQARQQVLHQH